MAKYAVELRPQKYTKNGREEVGYRSFVDGLMCFDGSSLTSAILAAGEVLLKRQRERQEQWLAENNKKGGNGE